MVAIVSANGLGLFNSSLSQLGSLFGGQAGIGQSRELQMVNIANGNLLLQDTDQILSACGFDASFLRTYNSRGLLSGVGQDGFVTGVERNVTLNGTLNASTSTVTLATGDGQNLVFKYSSANVYTGTGGSGAHDTLTWNATNKQWTLVEGSTQRQEVYADSADPVLKGRLLSIVDGKSLAEFDVIYDASNRVSAVQSLAAGDKISFIYNGSTTQLTAVTTVAGGTIKSRVMYGYDSFGRLTSVLTDLTPWTTSDNTWSATPGANDGCLFQTNYIYTNQTDGTDLRIASVSTSDGVTVAYTYQTDGAGGWRVRTVKQGTGAAAQTVTFIYNTGSTDVTDGAGRTWTYQYDANGQLTAVLQPIVNNLRTTTTYAYDLSGNVTQVKTVDGAATPHTLAETDCTYDPKGNVLWKWTLVDTTGAYTAVHYTYNAANQVLTEMRYAALDPDGPGTTAPSATGALTTTFVYDAQNRLRFTIDAAGEVTERQYATSGNGSGQLASVRQYLGATYAVASGVTEAALMSWATTAQQATSTLSTFAYDAKGRLQQQVDYATIDTVSTDAAYGQGVLDAAAAITRFTYNTQGQLLQKIVVHGSASDRAATVAGTLVPVTGMTADDGSQVTDYAYDGMGRLLSVIQHDLQYGINNDANALTTTYAYTDSGDQISVTLDSGAVRTELRNSAGQLVSVSEAGTVDIGGVETPVTRTTQNYYDATGLLRASKDALGAMTYYFYDGAGRLLQTVDPAGAVSQVQYDGLGRVNQTTQYATPVDTSGWYTSGVFNVTSLVMSATPPSLSAGQAWVPVDGANDRTNACTYDDLGRLSTQTDAFGTITTYAYDGQSHLVSTSASKPGDSADGQRVTLYYYDKADRLVGTVDPDGYLTESVYDDAGRLVKTIGYANPSKLGATLTTATTLATQRPVVTANDMVTRYFYDARGNLVGQLADAGGTAAAATGYLTTYGYDEQLHQTSVQAYSLLLTALAGTETLASLQATAAAAVTGGTATLQSTVRTFNGEGQLVSETNPEGTVTNYYYDEAGRLVRTQADANEGAAKERDTYTRYDVFGEVIGQVSGEQAVAANASLPSGKALNSATGVTDAMLDTAYGAYGTTNQYDADGRCIQSTDALGNSTWYFYDTDGRQTYTVRGNLDAAGNLNRRGEVTQNQYNAFGQVTGQIRYTSPIILPAAASWARVKTGLPTVAGATDTQRQMSYDQRGLLVQSIDGENAVDTYTYTAFGQVLQEKLHVGSSAAETIVHAYDLRGSQTSLTEASGTTIARTTSQIYDAFGRVTTSTDALGTVTSYTYDRLGRQLSHFATIEGRLETWSATYDAFDRTLTQTDALNNKTTYVYNDATRSMTVTTPEGVAMSTVHNAFGQTVQVTTAAGTASYGYDRNGELTSSTDANQKTSSNTYDVLGRLTESTDASLRKVDYAYDAVGRVLTRTVDPAGLALVTTYAYDAQGRVVKVTDASGDVTATGYDREGRVLSVTQDPNGLNLTTTYTWDAAGNELSVIQADGTAVQYVYDVLGRRITQIVDPGTGNLNLTTRYAYDVNDNLVRRNDANGKVTRFMYDHANRLIYTVDALGGMTRNWYDADGRVVATRTFSQPTDPTVLTDTTAFATIDTTLVWNSNDQGLYRIYDKDGRVRFTLDTAGTLRETTYDAASRVIGTRTYAAVVVPNAALQTKLLAGTAVVASITATRNDALDQQTYLILDADGRVRYTVDALGDVTELRYDVAGRLVEQLGYVTPLNAADLASAKTGTLSAQTVTDLQAQTSTAHITWQVYDGAGRASLSIDALGDVSAVTYDGAGRVIATRSYATALAPSALAAVRSSLAAGTAQVSDIVLSADDTRDLQSYQIYDAAGRLRYRIDGLGDVVEMRYDAAGRLVQQLSYVTPLSAADLAAVKAGTEFANGATFLRDLTGLESAAHSSYQVYDASGRLRFTVTRALVGGAVIGAVSENRYDAAGNLITQIRYNTTAIPFDPTQNEATLAGLVFGTSSANEQVTRYVYDADGRKRFVISDLGTVTEQRYDGVGRVVTSFNYGQTLALPQPSYTESAIAAAVSGFTDTRQVTYAYDAAGRLLSQTDVLGQTESYTYDTFGNRTSLTNKLGNLAGAVKANYTWTYTYDTAGRQTQITTPPVSVAYADQNGSCTYVTRKITTQIGYDALGNVRSRTEDFGQTSARTTTYQYDVRGYQTGITYPDPGALNGSGVLIATGNNPSITVTYDALGRAVVERDVMNNYSYKTYDDAGRLSIDVDAAGYATFYHYDALGEQVGLTRYEKALDTTTSAFTATNWQAGQAMTRAQAGSGITPANDRGITTTYDVAGNKASVVMSAVNYVKADGSIGQDTPTTLFQYNAYGELVLESTQLNDTAWANTYHYYDDLGRKTMDVDALGYITAYTYTAQGEIASQTEYATAVNTANLITTHAPAPPSSGGNATIGYDRVTAWTYDALGRKQTETSVGRHYQTSTGVAGVRDVVTTLQYDAVDEVTSATVDGVNTQMAYDALGHTIAVKQAARSILVSGYDGQITGSATTGLTTSGLTVQTCPYTVMAYDAFGNQVQTYAYANGRPGTAAPVASANDRNTTTQYDFQGRAVASRDALGNHVYHYYDAAGNVKGIGYTLDGNTGSTWVYAAFTYDALNRQLTAIGGGMAQTVQQVRYNAFGEVIAKGDSADPNALEVYYTYDAAGRMTSSNAQGGVRQSFYYDLAGHQALEQHWVTTTTTSATSNTDNWVNTVLTLDALGRATGAETYISGVVLTTSSQVFDRWGNVIKSTDANANATTYQYDALNQKTLEIRAKVTVVNADGTSQANQTPTLSWYYGAQGRLEGTQDARNNTTQYIYDAANDQVATIDPFNHAIRQAFDVFGDQVLNQDQLGYITWQNYDKLGRVVAHGDYTTNPGTTGTPRLNNTLESYTLDQNGDRIAVTDGIRTTAAPHGYTVYNDYDSRGLLIRSQSAMGVVMQYAYDANGNKTLEEDTEVVGGVTKHIGVQTWNNDFWGHALHHVNLSGHDTVSTYDPTTGELVWQANTAEGLARGISYYANGQVHTIAEAGGPTTSYQYDADGNRTVEDTSTVDGQGLSVHVVTTTTYDAENRIATVVQTSGSQTTLTLTYGYDEQGNRRHVHAASGYVLGTAGDQNAWYTYDAANRVVVANGALVNSQIVLNATTTDGYLQQYDAAGHMIGQEVWGTDAATNVAGLVLNKIDVDQRGETVTFYASESVSSNAAPVVTSTQQFDADGHLLATLNYYKPGTGWSWYDPDLQNTVSLDASGMLKSAQVYTYDGDGRLLTQQQQDRPAGWWRDAEGENHDPAQFTDVSVLTKGTTVSYANGTSANGTLGYDGAGRMMGYTYTAGSTQTFNYHYVGEDSWLEHEIDGVSTDGLDQPTSSFMTYDAAGRQLSIREHTTTTTPGIDDRLRYFAYDAAGEILRRMDGTDPGTGTSGGGSNGGGGGGGGGTNPPPDPGTGHQVNSPILKPGQAGTSGTTAMTFTSGGTSASHHQVYVNGQLLGSTDEAGVVDAVSNVTGFTSSTTGANTVVVQDGETLQDIAQRIYGNASLWYVLAAANGMDGSTSPTAGSVLKAPQVTTNQNDATTFKPYNPAEITGPTAPSLPHIVPPPPKSDHGCGVLGTIIMIVVMVVATVFTAGAATVGLAGSFGSIMSAGMGVMTAGAIGTVTAAAAAIMPTFAAVGIGTFVGSVASQAVGSLMGVAHFSWKKAVAAGAEAAITAGFGEMANAGDFGTTLQDASGIARAGAEAVVGDLAGYAVNKSLGLQASFSWKSIAADAVSSMIGAEASKGVNAGLEGMGVDPGTRWGQFAEDFVDRTVSGSISAGVRSAVGIPGKFDLGQIATDAFGNALADLIDGKDQAQATQYKIAQLTKQLATLLAQQKLQIQQQPTGTPVDGADGDATPDAGAAGTNGTTAATPVPTPAWLAATGIPLGVAQPLNADLVNKLLQKELGTVPQSLLDAADQLAADGWKLVVGGQKSDTSRKDMTISLALNQLGNSGFALMDLSHEVGHALNKTPEPKYYDHQHEDDYLKAYTDWRFDDEGQAEFFALSVRDQYKGIFAAAHPGVPFTITGDSPNHSYFPEYDKYLADVAGGMTADAAKAAAILRIGNLFRLNEVENNSGGETYSTEIARSAGEHWTTIQKNLTAMRNDEGFIQNDKNEIPRMLQTIAQMKAFIADPNAFTNDVTKERQYLANETAGLATVRGNIVVNQKNIDDIKKYLGYPSH